MKQNISYVLIDADGFVAEIRSMPEVVATDGKRVVILADGVLPTTTQLRVDLRKVRKPVTTVARLADVLLARPDAQTPDEHRTELARGAAIAELDDRYALKLRLLTGPLSSLHAEKRRQAAAGGGPLVADEADRLAILANAARQDAAVAELERQRRCLKARLKAAATPAEIEAVLATPLDGDTKSASLPMATRTIPI